MLFFRSSCCGVCICFWFPFVSSWERDEDDELRDDEVVSGAILVHRERWWKRSNILRSKAEGHCQAKAVDSSGKKSFDNSESSWSLVISTLVPYYEAEPFFAL